jgi:hypothetical protein
LRLFAITSGHPRAPPIAESDLAECADIKHGLSKGGVRQAAFAGYGAPSFLKIRELWDVAAT